MSRVCSACGTTVARQDCHKNRYAEYVCRSCQEAGIKFTRAGRLRYWTKGPLRKVARGLVYVGLTLLVMGALYVVLDKMVSAPAATPVQE
jgi:hypothetical protein